ncbi:MAG: response regulator [Planctomycetaceae bacterium]|nr:response regulator [Planctomycetaceae bacterium]
MRSANSTTKPAKRLPPTPWGGLPTRLRVLFVTTSHRTGGWLAEALAEDSACDVFLDEALGQADGLARLRDETYDAVLVSHDPGQLDAFELVAGMRGGGAAEPVVILGDDPEPEQAAFAYEVGADAYLASTAATTRQLIWILARATERHRLVREHARFVEAERQRLQQEQRDAQQQVEHQQGVLHRFLAAAELAARARGQAAPTPAANGTLPAELADHYAQLLRTYVIMGSGNLSNEMQLVARILVLAGVSPDRALALHLGALDELLQGLGNRSARHVMNRADLLVLEVLMHMAAGYRAQMAELAHPPQQMSLPGMI